MRYAQITTSGASSKNGRPPDTTVGAEGLSAPTVCIRLSGTKGAAGSRPLRVADYSAEALAGAHSQKFQK
ncbi:hypothetical protein GCM10025738_07030 [Microbacterium fluvii]